MMSVPPPMQRSAPDLAAMETVIVGAGIAGLACARRLHDAGRRFLLISEDVGGRMRRSRDGAVNLGAYYVRADYTHVRQYVRLGRRLDRLAVRRHDRAGTYSYWDRRLLFHLPQAARFLSHLNEFRHRYEILKRRTRRVGQSAALREDAMLLELYRQPATEFVAQHRFDDLARWYLEPALHGTAFAAMHEVSAFTLLLGAVPFLVPAFEFTPEFDRLLDGIHDAALLDSVVRVGPGPTGYEVETRHNGTLTTRRLVIATPPHVAQRLLGGRVAGRPVSAHMFQVSGQLRHPYERADIHLFAAADPTLAMARQADGTVLFSSQLRDPDLDRYFSSWQVLERKDWDPAFHLSRDGLVETEQGPGLYLIGDHNIVGLEDSYLTGLNAADRIISATQSHQTTMALSGETR